MTKVTFKIEKPTTRGERTPFAYFPDEAWDLDGNRACYAHVGQHGACAVEYARECRLAKYEEYKPLFDELVRIGYDDLVVTNRDFRTENAAPAAGRKAA